MIRKLTVSLLNINEAQLTLDILDKLAGLSKQDWQVQLILLDNGSEADQFQPLLDWVFVNKTHFAEALFIKASRNLGATGGRNTALKLASGQHILILDNDLVLPDDTNWLYMMWESMEANPQAAIVGPMLVFASHPDIVQATGIGLTRHGRVGYLNRGRSIATIPPNLLEVVASPAACWLVRKEAQQAVGLFSEEYYPVQYEDVDLCVRLGLTGWKTLCDCRIKIKHIENVTTRNLKDHPFARLTVKQGMRFREKWIDILPQIATISEDEIYWGPIPPSSKS